MTVYFENLSLRSFLAAFLRFKEVRDALLRRQGSISYVDASGPAGTALVPLLIARGTTAKRLSFSMREIKDDRGELIKTRVGRKDLFEFRTRLLEDEAYIALRHPNWRHGRFADYVSKALSSVFIMDPTSAARMLYLIQVVRWHAQRQGRKQSLFLVRCRPWASAYEDYASLFGVSLAAVSGRSLSDLKRALRALIYRFPQLYAWIKNGKDNRFGSATAARSALSKVYVDGRGDVNLENDGHHTDFAWFLNSAFPASGILYTPQSESERDYLERYGIAVPARNSDGGGLSRSRLVPKLLRARSFRREANLLRSIVASYNSTRTYWDAFFRTNNVKIFLTWYRFDNHHMAVADAIHANGGVSVYWPISFDGYRSVDCISNTDIVFSYSHFSSDLERQIGSTFAYNVITGYPRDHVVPLLRNEAAGLRRKLQGKGAEKILFVVDENSTDDERWHTGHALQRENYSFVLELLLRTPWLGVVFKPKAAKTLQDRLGPVADLLALAEETGRCHVYRKSSRHTTSAPPVLAGLSADLCIHGHLSSGTAAMECALAGLPTLLIDREGTPDSKLHELPRGKVVFASWEETIPAVMEHFETPGGIPGFGDWSPIIHDLDPFRDGMAANRMGTYLHWLHKGFEQGKDKHDVMAEAAGRYADRWGADKVVFLETPGLRNDEARPRA